MVLRVLAATATHRLKLRTVLRGCLNFLTMQTPQAAATTSVAANVTAVTVALTAVATVLSWLSDVLVAGGVVG